MFQSPFVPEGIFPGDLMGNGSGEPCGGDGQSEGQDGKDHLVKAQALCTNDPREEYPVEEAHNPA